MEYVAIYFDSCEGESYLLRLTRSLEEAQAVSGATSVIVFEDGEPIEEYYYVPERRKRIGEYWPPGPPDQCMYAPLPIYSDKEVTPARWDGPRGYTAFAGCGGW